MTASTISTTLMDLEYRYPAGQNNGRITQMKDVVTGEEVTYTYDALQRLTQAAGSASTRGAAWTQTFTYDGFGNLTQKQHSSLPLMSIAVDGASNRIVGEAYDANGNMLGPNVGYWQNGVWHPGPSREWDGENRMTAQVLNGHLTEYVYDPWGRRVMKRVTNADEVGQPWQGTWEYVFYGLDGRKLQTFGSGGDFLGANADFYFGGMRVSGQPAVTDRLGSERRAGENYLPYGEEPVPTADNRDKFATYWRDASGGEGQDYAQARYYSAGWGRFWSVDPAASSARKANPNSWNRYAYVNGDPVNYRDPLGLMQANQPEWLVYADNDGFGGGWGDLTDSWGGGGNPCSYGAFGLLGVDPQLALACLVAWTPPRSNPKPEPPEKPVEPKCFAQLKYRSIDMIGIGLVANHSFWWVQDRFGQQYIISAGPHTSGEKQYLNVWIVKGASNGKDNSKQKTAWESGLSAKNCDPVEEMLAAAYNFPRDKIVYNSAGGPNSNIAAHYLGTQGGFNPTTPPLSWGWGTPIPMP